MMKIKAIPECEKYYVIANDDEVIAKVNEDWIAYAIIEKLKDRYEKLVVCRILGA